MDRKIRVPFKGMSTDGWLKLILAAVLTFNLINFASPLLKGNWCMSVDFCGYYGAGQVWNQEGGPAIYDQDMLWAYQKDLFSAMNVSGADDAQIVSMVYLPVFLFPFRAFALIPFRVSLLLWYGLNFAALVLYLMFFSRKVSGKKLPWWTLLWLLAAYPVFRNFYDGQFNLLLLICMGEFLRATTSDKPIWSGVWLGGWLLKPQLLILILPFLLIQKKYKALLGFIISSIVLASLSFLLVGWEGLLGLKDVIFASAGGGANSHPEYMMNWRTVGLFVSLLSTPALGQVILWSGSIVTALIPLYVFRKKLPSDSPMFIIGVLGIVAATITASYHTHLHTAIILIPIVLYLFLRGFLDQKVLQTWVLIPFVSLILVYVVGIFTGPETESATLVLWVMLIHCLMMLGASLYLVGWAAAQKKAGLVDLPERQIESNP
jgi:hypothetical protein